MNEGSLKSFRISIMQNISTENQCEIFCASEQSCCVQAFCGRSNVARVPSLLPSRPRYEMSFCRKFTTVVVLGGVGFGGVSVYDEYLIFQQCCKSVDHPSIHAWPFSIRRSYVTLPSMSSFSINFIQQPDPWQILGFGMSLRIKPWNSKPWKTWGIEWNGWERGVPVRLSVTPEFLLSIFGSV